MGLNWNLLKWVQGEMRNQSLHGHHCCSFMVPVMAHGALRYVTCLAQFDAVRTIITSLPVLPLSYTNPNTTMSACKLVRPRHIFAFLPAHFARKVQSVMFLLHHHLQVLCLRCATFCSHAKLAACMRNFHTAVLQCRRTFCHGLPHVVIIALLSASEATAPAATSLLAPTPMPNPMMTWRMSLPLCLIPPCSLHTPWAASLGKGGLLYTHVIDTDQSLSLSCSQISTIQT